MKHKEHIWYGGDYNPDQWPEETWENDLKLLKEAGVNMLTLPVFSWSRIEQSEGQYDLEWLDKVFKLAHSYDMKICFATSTAVQPAWMSKKYPLILPTDARGMKRRFGGRVNFCPNSRQYKDAARKLVEKLAIFSKAHENVVMWHIGNEYDNYCYCDTCRDEFRAWAKERYGSIDVLNKKWYMNFWGHQLTSFDEIELPDFRSENWEMNGAMKTNFQTILLDYHRFMNDSILSCYLNELEVVKEITPDIPVTTNLMGAFKPLDYFKWAKHMDVISWDHYPGLGEPAWKSAMLHDLMRSLKKEPFWLMEQSPSQQNWAPYNTLKRPGTLRLQSYQTMARGADAIMYFQMKKSLANCEKFHGAIIDHVNHGETRVYKECQTIGTELPKLKEIIGSQVKAEVGLVFDWENWWAIEMSSGPSIALNYRDNIEKYYKALHKNHHMVDFIHEEDDLSPYKVIYAPMLYMTKKKMFSKLEAFVAKGGTLVLTTFSGIVDENDHATRKGYPGLFREMAGVWVEEIDALLPNMQNAIKNFNGADYNCNLLCDIINVETAEILGTYGHDFYKGKPVVTKNHYHKGLVYYIGTVPDDDFINDFTQSILTGPTLPEGIEKSTRSHDQVSYDFYINYDNEQKEITFKTPVENLLTGQVSQSMIVQGKDLLIVRH